MLLSPVAEWIAHFVFFAYLGIGWYTGYRIAREQQPKQPLPWLQLTVFFFIWQLFWLPMIAKNLAETTRAKRQRRPAQ